MHGTTNLPAPQMRKRYDLAMIGHSQRTKKSKSLRQDATKWTIDSWLTATPFGRPVEPEVKMTYANCWVLSSPYLASTKCFWLRGVRFKENLQLCQELATCSTCPEQIKNLNHLEYFGVVWEASCLSGAIFAAYQDHHSILMSCCTTLNAIGIIKFR